MCVDALSGIGEMQYSVMARWIYELWLGALSGIGEMQYSVMARRIYELWLGAGALSGIGEMQYMHTCIHRHVYRQIDIRLDTCLCTWPHIGLVFTNRPLRRWHTHVDAQVYTHLHTHVYAHVYANARSHIKANVDK